MASLTLRSDCADMQANLNLHCQQMFELIIFWRDAFHNVPYICSLLYPYCLLIAGHTDILTMITVMIAELISLTIEDIILRPSTLNAVQPYRAVT